MTMLLDPGSFWTALIAKSPRALAELSQEEMFVAFVCHITGNWGELDEFGWRINDDAREYGGRIVSWHRANRGQQFLIESCVQRPVARILFPGESL